MTPIEQIRAAMEKIYARDSARGSFDAELDGNMVTVYLNGSPRYFMHVDTFLKLYDETTQSRGTE